MVSDLKILIVEDEPHIARALKLNLEMEGAEADHCESAKLAANRLLSHGYSVILLDVELPDMSGFELCRRIRDHDDFTPVIMLTVRDSPEDKVEGLEAGADDYLSKPFEFSELLARIKSVLRRRSWEAEKRSETTPALTTVGNATIDLTKRILTIGNEEVELTSLEFDLLQYFLSNPGRAIRREELLEKVWKLRDYPNTRTVDNFVSRLRRHLEEDPSHPRFIKSVRGYGYRFVPNGD